MKCDQCGQRDGTWWELVLLFVCEECKRGIERDMDDVRLFTPRRWSWLNS